MAYSFQDPPETTAFTCTHVLEGAPILFVSYEDNEWQFLCGGQHSPEDGRIIALGEAAGRDPGLNKISNLHAHQYAKRETPDSEWVVQDSVEENIRRNVKEHGWFVSLFEATEDLPAFAYSIGMFKTFAVPEIIVFGLDVKTMHQVINLCGTHQKERAIVADRSYPDFFASSEAIFKPVAEEHYAEYLGYANWFYTGADYPVLQCCWSVPGPLFPWDAEWPEALQQNQPRLFT